MIESLQRAVDEATKYVECGFTVEEACFTAVAYNRLDEFQREDLPKLVQNRVLSTVD